MLVSIVIPCYNSEKTIEKVVDLSVETFQKLKGYELEMVLVNDCSKDGTFAAIRRAAEKYPNVIGVDLAKNVGQHGALLAGFHYVHGEYIVGMDDDLQNHPSQIPAFLDKINEGYDVVFGVFEQRKFSVWKNITGAVSRFLLWRFLDRPKGIEMGSFWIARRFVTDNACRYRGTNPMVQALFFQATSNIANITIRHYEREYGKSNYTFKKGLALFMSFLNYSVAPLRIASFSGVVLFVVGIVSAVVVLIRRLLNPDMAVGWASLMCILLILFGFVFMLLGILGEYIGKVVLTANNTPRYVVREELNTGLPAAERGNASDRFRTNPDMASAEYKSNRKENPGNPGHDS